MKTITEWNGLPIDNIHDLIDNVTSINLDVKNRNVVISTDAMNLYFMPKEEDDYYILL